MLGAARQPTQGATVRVTSLLRKIVGNAQTRVRRWWIENGALILRVRPTWRVPRCSACGRQTREQGRVATENRRWRHLDFAGAEVQLEYTTRLVRCPTCERRVVERVPWALEPRANFTEDFDDQVASLTQRCDKTAVTQIMGISWRAVGRCVERVMRRRGQTDLLEDLTVIGIDELSYRKQHNYLTLVTDLRRRRIVWGVEGKSSENVLEFLRQLGPERCRRIKVVCSDMAPWWVNTIREALPHAQVVFDRFHVQQLASVALDETRRAEWQRTREARGEGTAARWIKNLRWALLKSNMTLTEAQRASLVELKRANNRLYSAYLLKEQLGDILDRTDVPVVEELLKRWCSSATRTKLPRFQRVAKTILRHMDGILGYVRLRVTNGPTEGLNNKARLLTRRAYGFHSAEAVLAMIRLCCSGLHLPPVRRVLAG
jgi:transposase